MAYTNSAAKAIVAGALKGLKSGCPPAPYSVPTSMSAGKFPIKAKPAPMTPHQQKTSMADGGVVMPTPRTGTTPVNTPSAMPEKPVRATRGMGKASQKAAVPSGGSLFPAQRTNPRKTSYDTIPGKAQPKMPRFPG